MNVDINHCGTNSIIGAVYVHVFEKGLKPDKVVVNIDTVMNATDVHKELAKAQEAFAGRNVDIELGVVKHDLYKAALLRDPKTVCYS